MDRHTLHPFQAKDVVFHQAVPRSMMLYEPRLGKTPTALSVMGPSGSRTCLIRCPVNALYVWRDHINDWWPDLTGSEDYEIRLFKPKHGDYAGDRLTKWSSKRVRKTTFYICTYAAFQADEKLIRQNLLMPDWLINDEAKRLRNHKSIAFKAEKPFAALARMGLLFLEGTPTKRGPIDFFTMLNLIDPKRFGSYWDFMNHFYDRGIVPGGAEPFDVDTLQNLPHWYEILARLSRVRFRKDVRPEMPSTQRQVIPVEMDAIQEKLYLELGEIRFAFTPSGQLILAQTTLEGLTRMRQILTCPKVLDPGLESYGQAIISFADTVDDMAPEARSHLVVFTSFKMAIPYFEEYLRSRGHQRIFRLAGDTDAEEGHIARQQFKRDGGIVLCTTSYAEAFSLEPAYACYHIGCAYDPNTNKQAEDRLTPQVGVNPIYSGYFTYEGTHDQRIVEILNGYQRMIDVTLRPTND